MLHHVKLYYRSFVSGVDYGYSDNLTIPWSPLHRLGRLSRSATYRFLVVNYMPRTVTQISVISLALLNCVGLHGVKTAASPVLIN
jgi:hypothetical protein